MIFTPNNVGKWEKDSPKKNLYHTTNWSGKDETFMANPNNQNIGQLLKIKEEKRKKQFKERNVKVKNCLSGRFPAKLEIFARKTLKFFPVWRK